MSSSVGKAWVVYSQDTSTGEKQLISLISPRRTVDFVCRYVEQMYVDRFASIDEKVEYKKRPSSWPYGAKVEHPSGIIHCGHSPIFNAIYCHSLEISESSLHAKFKAIRDCDENLRPTEFFEVEVSIAT